MPRRCVRETGFAGLLARMSILGVISYGPIEDLGHLKMVLLWATPKYVPLLWATGVTLVMPILSNLIETLL